MGIKIPQYYSFQDFLWGLLTHPCKQLKSSLSYLPMNFQNQTKCLAYMLNFFFLNKHYKGLIIQYVFFIALHNDKITENGNDRTQFRIYC